MNVKLHVYIESASIVYKSGVSLQLGRLRLYILRFIKSVAKMYALQNLNVDILLAGWKDSLLVIKRNLGLNALPFAQTKRPYLSISSFVKSCGGIACL